MAEQKRELTPEDYLAILRRRWLLLLIPTVVIGVGAYLVSLRIPNRYTSTALVLIQPPQVPQGYVKSVVGDDIQQRLATMQEQILSRTTLQPIIENFSLFKNEHLPMEELVDRLRRNIVVTAIRDENASRTGGLPGFYLSYTSEDARTAQQVCNELVSRFINANVKVRTDRAKGTTEFLSSQLDDAKKKLDDQDAKVAQFKQKYLGQLPGQEQSNLTMLNTLTNQLDAANQAVARAQQDKTYAESLLQQQVATWQAMQGPNNTQDLEAQVLKLQQQLTDLQSRYTSEHPEVVRVRGELARTRERLQQARAAGPANPSDAGKAGPQSEPPFIQQLRLQVHQLGVIVKDKIAEQERVQRQMGTYQSRVQLSPVVEEQYKVLTRDYETALRSYNDILTNKNSSEMAKDLELRNQGEQFSLMDAPNLPEKPVFPDRPLITGGGFGGGLAIGFVIVAVLEMKDKSLRSERDVSFHLGLPTLALVPWIDEAQGNGKRRFWSRKNKEEVTVAAGSA